jgi:replicative DNA helicase
MNSALFNEEIEQALLGCLIISDSAYDDVPNLKQEHFYFAAHARIYSHIKKFRDAGRQVTPAQLAQYFQGDETLADAGGAQYIQDLAEAVITAVHARGYADHLHELYLRRTIKAMAGQLTDLADNPDIETSPQSLLAQAEKIISDAGQNTTENTIRHISDCTQKTIERLNAPQMGIRSGIPKLDAMLRGFKSGELYIIAGRPGMGKTAMGLTLALNAAIARQKTLFFSLEMPQEQLTQRLLSRLSGECVHSGEPYDADKVQQAAEKLNSLPLYVEDKSGLTVTEIAASARRHKRKFGLDLLVVDYLGLIAVEDRRANKVHQIEEITTNLKRLSKDLGIPVILLSQLSRALEGRDNKRPMLSDLRDSGAIEQDADVVMFIYREEYYAAENAPPENHKTIRYKGANQQAAELADIEAMKGKAEVIIAKNRQYRTGTAHIRFDAEKQVFHD